MSLPQIQSLTPPFQAMIAQSINEIGKVIIPTFTRFIFEIICQCLSCILYLNISNETVKCHMDIKLFSGIKVYFKLSLTFFSKK